MSHEQIFILGTDLKYFKFWNGTFVYNAVLEHWIKTMAVKAGPAVKGACTVFSIVH